MRKHNGAKTFSDAALYEHRRAGWKGLLEVLVPSFCLE